MYTVDHPFGDCSKKFICTNCLEIVCTKFIGRNFKQFETSIGRARFAAALKGCMRMSDCDPRTGTFHQTRVTAGDVIGL